VRRKEAGAEVGGENGNEGIPVGDCTANITWNVRKIIELSTGLPWKNCENNGLCIDVIPRIAHGLTELVNHPEKYKPYEASNGWGTVESTIRFFETILKEWEDFRKWEKDELVNITTFWIK
jgi:hypothetical protein